MMKSLACGMALTLFLQLIQSKIDLLSISDRLCLSALIFCTVSAIRISVKSHIGASLGSNGSMCGYMWVYLSYKWCI